MNKVVVHVDPVSGNTCITRCVPWARLVAGDPPLPLEDAQPKIRSVDAYNAVASSIEWAETEEEFAHRVAVRLGLADYTIVDESPVLNGDRTFRNALRLVGSAFDYDMPKARTIWLGRIRHVRDVELAKLDVETVKALGVGDNVRRDTVEAQKQVLRGIPQNFDLSVYQTTAELKAAWPPELPRPGNVAASTPSQLAAARRQV